jgi:thiol-disulfide isomerase/thioredoxin
MSRYLIIILLFFYFSKNYANQNHFNVTLKWSRELLDLKIYINNGIESKTITPKINDYQITISDIFIGKYAVISVSNSSKNKLFPEYCQFYISRKPATIIFNANEKLSRNSNKKIKLINALDVTQKIKEYNEIFQTQEVEKENYLQKNGLDSIYYSIFRKIIIKKLDYIKKNKNTYFAFKKFESELVPLNFPFQDSLIDSFLSFYSDTFSIELQKSLEGRKVKKKLDDKWIITHDGIKAPEFETIDYLGNKINSKDLKGKYVLINFWATWCGPCMAELPAIKKINEKYTNKNITIISISFDKDFNLFLESIKKNNLDWINVHYDEEFALKFGGRNSLPQLFLIDAKGTIIYNRISSNETDYVNLATLNKILESELDK